MVDKISQLIHNLKVSNLAGKEILSLPHSNYTEEILKTLEKTGYIKSFSKKGKKAIKTLEIELAYEDGKSKIEGVQQISKNSRRLYTSAADVHGVRNGYGILVLTTPKGVMTDAEARKAKVGGEPLFKMW